MVHLDNLTHSSKNGEARMDGLKIRAANSEIAMAGKNPMGLKSVSFIKSLLTDAITVGTLKLYNDCQIHVSKKINPINNMITSPNPMALGIISVVYFIYFSKQRAYWSDINSSSRQ